MFDQEALSLGLRTCSMFVFAAFSPKRAKGADSKESYLSDSETEIYSHEAVRAAR